MRKPNRANDYITRAECQALIVYTINHLFAEMEKNAAAISAGEWPVSESVVPLTAPTVHTPAVVPATPGDAVA